MAFVEFISTPNSALFYKIATFLHREAEWYTTPFDVSLAKHIYAVVHDTDKEIIATGTIAYFSTAWLGNIVVAKAYRRKGLASKVVAKLLEKVASDSTRVTIGLITSPYGKDLYPTLGFTAVDYPRIGVCKRPRGPPPPLSTLAAVRPSLDEHRAAVKLYEQYAGVSRAETLNAIFRHTGQCAIVRENGQVVAAAWARYTTDLHDRDKSGLLLGPAVAKSSDAAESVCGELIRMHGRQYFQTNKGGDCGGAVVLVPKWHGDDGGMAVFRALGFAEHLETSYMIRRPAGEQDGNHKPDISCSTDKYYALIGWDLG